MGEEKLSNWRKVKFKLFCDFAILQRLELDFNIMCGILRVRVIGLII